MKSKPLLSLLLYYLGVTCAWAQYDVTIAAGSAQKYTEFSDQFLSLSPGGTDLAKSSLGTSLSAGATIYTWNPSTSLYSSYAKVSNRGVITWSPSDPMVTPGEAFICIDPNGSGFTATFTGSPGLLASAIPSFSPSTTWYFLGSQTYHTTPTTYTYAEITGYANPGVTGVSLYRAKTLLLGYPPSTGVPSEPVDDPGDWNEYWYDGTAWHPTTPTINAGEAVWIGPSLCSIAGTIKDSSGNPLSNWEVYLSNGQYTFTDPNGNYRFAAPSTGGEFTVTVIPPCGWTVTAPQSVSATCPGTTLANFVGTLESGSSATRDLAVTVIYVPDPGTPAFPCQLSTGSYYVYYENKCGSPVPPPTVTLTVNLSTHVQYGTLATPGTPSWSQISGSATGGTGTGPTLTWTLYSMPPGNVGIIKIPIQVKSAGVTLTTVLTTTATIKPIAGDAHPADNTYTSSVKAKCAFDPNSKIVQPEGCGPAGLINNQPLTYTIQFQNDGTAPAFQVVVNDQLDPSLDPSTLTLLGASGNYVFNLSGNQMTWTFPNIDLPDTNDNLAGSYGFVSYQVQPLAGLADGTVITNQASIVFDENPPVLTDTTTNSITSATMPSASFTVTPLVGSADATNDFTYTGGTAGATYYWDFGTDAIPATSTNESPTNVVFLDDGLTTVNLQVSADGCTSDAASYLLNVGVPVLNIATTGANQFVLSWDGDGYSLQQSSTLSAPVPWQSFSQPLTQVGATYFTPPITISNVTTFFRLTDGP